MSEECHTVLVDGQAVSGRVALLIAELLRCQGLIERVGVGQVQIAFDHRRVHPPRITETALREGERLSTASG